MQMQATGLGPVTGLNTGLKTMDGVRVLAGVGGRVLAFYHSHPGLGRRILSSTYIHGSQAPDRMVGDNQVYTALVDTFVTAIRNHLVVNNKARVSAYLKVDYPAHSSCLTPAAAHNRGPNTSLPQLLHRAAASHSPTRMCSVKVCV